MNTLEPSSLNTLAESLEQKTLDLIQAGRWQELDAMIAPECQFATHQGVLDKSRAISLMQEMQLTAATMRHINATRCGDNLIVSFELACTERINGQPQSRDFSPRLSVWKRVGNAYLCIAYGDFNRV